MTLELCGDICHDTQLFTHHSVVTVSLLVELAAGKGVGAEAQKGAAMARGAHSK